MSVGYHVATGRRELEGDWRIRGRVRHFDRHIDRLKPVRAAMIGFSRITASQLFKAVGRRPRRPVLQDGGRRRTSHPVHGV